MAPKNTTNLLYNPAFRSIVFQISAVLALLFFFYTIVDNALTNLEVRGIETGFDFLGQQAGFGIGLTLIDYDETYSYGRTFVVGLLNTALVSILGIVFTTILGFLIGIARLSSNWLVSRLAAVYIEVFRNVPLLLQIFFWYFAVLQALPSARQSFSLGEAIFLNVRGLYFPSPIFESGSAFVVSAFIMGVITAIGIKVWAKKRQSLTGQQTSLVGVVIGLIFVLPIVVYLSLIHI